jgi:asparagine synthetase B (glutamine-hydrolysing)
MKMRRFVEKSALRNAMRGILPADVVARAKRPFAIPLGDWFFAEERPAYVDEMLGPRQVARAGLFDPDAVSDLRREVDLMIRRPAPAESMLRLRRELTLMLVLGAQLLDHALVSRRDGVPASPAGSFDH